jgi:hypothetical protein
MRLVSIYSFLVDIRVGHMGWYWSKCVNWRSRGEVALELIRKVKFEGAGKMQDVSQDDL